MAKTKYAMEHLEVFDLTAEHLELLYQTYSSASTLCVEISSLNIATLNEF